MADRHAIKAKAFRGAPIPLTAATLDARTAERKADLAKYQAAMWDRVRRSLADAAAHARNAITESARKTPEGRATAAKVRRSPSYRAALNRLDELRDTVVGVVALARSEEYRRAWRFWHDHLSPSAVRDADGAATAGIRRCQAAMLHGMTARQEIEGRLAPYRRRLLAVLCVASNRATQRPDGADLIDSWERQAADGIAATTMALLNDSFVLADRMAGRDVIRPELLEPDPSLPE